MQSAISANDEIILQDRLNATICLERCFTRYRHGTRAQPGHIGATSSVITRDQECAINQRCAAGVSVRTGEFKLTTAVFQQSASARQKARTHRAIAAAIEREYRAARHSDARCIR